MILPAVELLYKNHPEHHKTLLDYGTQHGAYAQVFTTHDTGEHIAAMQGWGELLVTASSDRSQVAALIKLAKKVAKL